MTGVSFRTVEISEPSFEVGGLRCATVFSDALGHRVDCTVWRPPGRHSTLPLVVLLHGVYGSHWAWALNGGAHMIAADLVEAGRVPPFALAMPSDGLYRHGSGYVTSQDGAVERWIVEEVPALAGILVPGVDPDAQVALAGLSMGGFGALVIGAWHGHRVVASIGMSSITEFDRLEMFVGSMEGYELDGTRRSVIGSVLSNRDRLPRIHINCGTDDPLIADNRRLHDALAEAGVEHSWAEHDGGHDWKYWHAHVRDAIVRSLQAFSS